MKHFCDEEAAEVDEVKKRTVARTARKAYFMMGMGGGSRRKEKL